MPLTLFRMKSAKKFYNCQCFYYRNIFIKKYKTHFVFETDEQFSKDYEEVLKNLPEEEIGELIQNIKDEISRRKRVEHDSQLCKKQVKESYTPLSSRLFHLQEEFFHSSFIELHNRVSHAAKKEDLLPKLDVISKDKQVYGFPLFTREICDELIAELENFEASHFPKNRPNSMNRYGILLDEMGLYENFVDPLRVKYLNPLAKILYPDLCGDSGLDSHRAYTVQYEVGKDEDLDLHYDNSEITLNVCLGKDFSGGELFFGCMRTDLSCISPYKVYSNQVGHCVLHRGQLMHGTMPVTEGSRSNMVMWMRSSGTRNKLCPRCNQEPQLQAAEADSYGDGFTKDEELD